MNTISFKPGVRWARLAAGCVLLSVLSGPAYGAAAAAPADAGAGSRSDDILRVVLLQDYNTRVVVAGTMLLGIASGVVGTLLLLRKRALLGDALSHATLPGIALAFMFMAAAGGTGKWLPGLLFGALVTGVLGVLCIIAIVSWTRIKEDTALGIILSVFFGAGVAVLGLAQRMQGGSAAGLEGFIYGKTASMIAADAWLIAGTAVVVTAITILLLKEFTLLCFDDAYAGSQGWPIWLLELLLMGLVAVVTVIGLQAVGLILMIALLVIPAAAARFWTERLPAMLAISATIGALSGLVGALISALAPRLPAGAIIVLVASVLFLLSMVFAGERGVFFRWLRYVMLRRKTERQNLLRALFEMAEQRGSSLHPSDAAPAGTTLHELARHRAWSRRNLRRIIARAGSAGLVRIMPDGRIALTEAGLASARQVVRNHRLWELYLLEHADVATAVVDRDADRVEHVLGPEMIDELEHLLLRRHPHLAWPGSPHALAARPDGGTAR